MSKMGNHMIREADENAWDNQYGPEPGPIARVLYFAADGRHLGDDDLPEGYDFDGDWIRNFIEREELLSILDGHCVGDDEPIAYAVLVNPPGAANPPHLIVMAGRGVRIHRP